MPSFAEAFLGEILLSVGLAIVIFVVLSITSAGILVALAIAAGVVAVLGAINYFLWGQGSEAEVA